jgi:molybdopterin-guanine dinucleotide biosynthesis protein A
MEHIMNEEQHKETVPLAGVILAGGKNIRMGVNKAFLTVYGQRIIDRTAAMFNALFRQVILVTNAPLEYASLNLEIAVDLFPANSPLAGIYTGLYYSSHPYAFVAGCDMPLISRPVLEYMTSLCPGHDVIIPRLDDGYHPLHAVYSRRLIKPMGELIRGGKLKITEVFSHARVREVTAAELRPLDRELRSFLNLNTPEDLRKVTDHR